jgi:hypothetical protein
MNDRLPEPSANPALLPAAERASATPRHDALPSVFASARATGIRPQSLRELQGFILQAICAAEPVDARAVVAAGPRLSAAERLHIYRHAYSARLRECLRDDYPVLAATLGEAGFEALCQEYVERHPSASPSLNRFGRHMPSVCASCRALTGNRFLAELAALEWALVEVTHAATAKLDLAELQRLTPEAWGGARLICSPALRLLRFDHPVNAYYQSYRALGTLQALPAALPSATAVYRRDLLLWRMDLTPAMTRVLEALMARSTIAHALSQLSVDEHDPLALAEAERSVMVWFREWVSAGFFADVVCS